MVRRPCARNGSLAPEAGLLTPGSSLPRAFPGRMSQWRTSGSLPGHSGATVPDSHRLHFSAGMAPRWLPPRAPSVVTGILAHRDAAGNLQGPGPVGAF